MTVTTIRQLVNSLAKLPMEAEIYKIGSDTKDDILLVYTRERVMTDAEQFELQGDPIETTPSAHLLKINMIPLTTYTDEFYRGK